MPATSTPHSNGRNLQPIEAIKNGLERMRPQLQVALPKQIPVERFERVVMTAVNMNPGLVAADRRTLFNSCMKCATDGLLPDGREAALVVFGRDVVYMPMVFGIIKKLRQSGEIASISARIVYDEEVKQGRFNFIISDGQERLTHEPILIGERGRPVAVYATARFKDGTVQNEPLSVADVEKVRAVSRAKNSGPWVNWWDEMARKTAIRRLSKYLPLSAEDRRLLDRDEEPTEFDALKAAAIETATPQSLALAAAQLGDDAEEEHFEESDEAETGRIIEEGEQILADETAHDEETPLTRGLRLLANQSSKQDIADLRASVSEELTTDDEQQQWKTACLEREKAVGAMKTARAR